ncbi:MAG: TRAP transporter small permease subunit [Peptococcaceae bacterium]|nr:TRAP transporter small permease subunit [Peptococcaceae bacterium]
MSSFLSLIDRISEWTGKLSAFLIVILSFMIGYEVVSRYIFNRPTLWVNETSAMLFGAYIIFGGAYTLSAGGHINMDLVYQRFTKRQKALIDLITFWFFALFCVVLVWKGGDSAWYSLKNLEHSGTLWNPPVYPIKLVLPIGAFLLLLQGVAKFIRDAKILVGGGDGS